MPSTAPPSASPPALRAWLEELERQRRVVRLNIGGEERFVAVEDVGRYRDAVGVPPPVGVPQAFLEPVRDPLTDLVARYARSHGPFHAEDVARRLGVGVGPVLSALAALESRGSVVQGEFRPGGAGREWCDAGVLRTLRQRSLARLRREVEPVEQAALGRLYVQWQNVAAPRRGADALVEAIEQLQGAAVPASDLESRVLPARLAEYHAHDLDELAASGAVVWVGCEPLGERDGRIALYLAEHLPLLLPSAAADTSSLNGPLHGAIRNHLSARGASFFQQLLLACGGAFQQDVVDALWDLVWAGEVTNDTLQPLRAYLNPRRGGTRGGSRMRGPSLRTRALFPPEVSGRWSLVTQFLYGNPSPTEKLTARTRQLLDRYGVLVREAVQAEGIGGGFSSLYPVLKRLEETGHLRRGYFVAGLGATQFALPGAMERLRALREPGGSFGGDEGELQAVVLAATDPANPYGAALAWPGRPTESTTHPADPTEPAAKGSGRRASRSAGATVILVEGALAGWMGRGERNLLAWPDCLPEVDSPAVLRAIARALAAEVAPGKRRAVFVKEINGKPAQSTPFARPLEAAGFRFGPQGYMKRL